MTRPKNWGDQPKPKVSLAHPGKTLAASPAQNAEWVAEHEAAVQRLHPELKAAFDAWQKNGHAGSLYDYLPNNYRQYLK